MQHFNLQTKRSTHLMSADRFQLTLQNWNVRMYFQLPFSIGSKANQKY